VVSIVGALHLKSVRASSVLVTNFKRQAFFHKLLPRNSSPRNSVCKAEMTWLRAKTFFANSVAPASQQRRVSLPPRHFRHFCSPALCWCGNEVVCVGKE
jgi:hypothetical protein